MGAGGVYESMGGGDDGEKQKIMEVSWAWVWIGLGEMGQSFEQKRQQMNSTHEACIYLFIFGLYFWNPVQKHNVPTS